MPKRPFWLLETRDFLAIVMTSAMVGLMFVMVLRPGSVPPDSPVINMLLGGFMTVGFSAVMQFYFGSSKDSVTKTDTISSIATGVSEAPPAPVQASLPRPTSVLPQPQQPQGQGQPATQARTST